MSDVTAAIIARMRALEARLAALERRETPYTAIGARVYNSQPLTVGTASWTALTFDTERFDTDGIHSTSTNTERLTCVTPGVYAISGSVYFESNTTGRRIIRINIDNTTVAQHEHPALAFNELSISTVFQLTAGQYATLHVYQSSGGDVSIAAASAYSPEFAMVRIA